MVCLYVYWLVPFNKVPTISDKVSSLSGRLSFRSIHGGAPTNTAFSNNISVSTPLF